MRGYFLRAASLAAGILFGGYALAQAPDEGSGAPGGQSDEIPGDELPHPSLPDLSASISQASQLRQEAEEGLGKAASPASGWCGGGRPQAASTIEAPGRQLESPAPPAPEAVRKQISIRSLSACGKHDPEDAQRIAETIERPLQSYSEQICSCNGRRLKCAWTITGLSLFDKLVAGTLAEA
jgi:hypothetical protein